MLTLANIKNEISNDLNEINIIISNTLLETSDPTLQNIYTHLLKNKGKQVRASLMILIHKINPCSSKDLHIIASAVELIHLASLVHDDIIDDAEIRRNQKTINQKFGNNNGIITGVHIYSKALELIATVGNNEILKTISISVNELCEGESFQVNNRHNYTLTRDDYWRIIHLKTSALFRAACTSASILSNLNKPSQILFNRFGTILGNIFQLTDDYLDIFDNKNKLSKKIEQDLTTGDISLPILMAIENVSVSKPTIETIKSSLNEHQLIIGSSIKSIIYNEKESAEELLQEIQKETNTDTKKIQGILDLVVNRIK